MFKKIAIASAAASLFGIGHGAWAGQAANTMNVTATVSANCLVSTPAPDFSGAYDPVSTNAAADLNFSSSVIFNCTKNSSTVTVGITHGNNYTTNRRLKDGGGTNFLNYDLYQPSAVGAGATCPYSQVFDTSGAGLFAVTGGNFATSTTAVTVKVCGKVPQAQDVPATGAYTDAVSVQVNF